MTRATSALRRMSPTDRRLFCSRAATVAIVLITLQAITYGILRQDGNPVLVAYWVVSSLVIVGCLGAFLVGHRYLDRPIAQGGVLAIVPAYNEDPAALRTCIWSLIDQDVPPDRIVVIDDGSTVPVVPFEHPLVWWHRQDNTGKRGAQVTALKMFDRHEFDYVVTVDSDSAPYPDALGHLLRAMSDDNVQAATGMIWVRNHRASVVAAAADIDIGTSCVLMRASRSMLGALETTSGALAIYRSDLLYDHLEEYAIECGTGDDRWLTLRALQRGEVVAVAEAGVETDMPTTLRGTYRQRMRWARSWWCMLPYAFGRLKGRQLISPTYGLILLVLAPLWFAWIVTCLTKGSVHTWADPALVAVYGGAYVIVRFACSALYLIGRPGLSRRDKLRAWIVGTPAAILLNAGLLIPIRYWALLRIRDNRWQTRTQPAPESLRVPTGA